MVGALHSKVRRACRSLDSLPGPRKSAQVSPVRGGQPAAFPRTQAGGYRSLEQHRGDGFHEYDMKRVIVTGVPGRSPTGSERRTPTGRTFAKRDPILADPQRLA